MTYRVIKTIKGIEYLYEQKSRREGGRVKSTSKYIGRVSDLCIVNTTKRTTIGDITNMDFNNSIEEVRNILQSVDFANFINGQGASKIFPVGVVPDDVKKTMGATESVIRLSVDTATKQKREHPEVNHETYQMVQSIVDNGESMSDRENHLSFFHTDENDKIWYLVIKVTKIGEIYLQSFRRSNDDHKERIKKRTQNVKAGKEYAKAENE